MTEDTSSNVSRRNFIKGVIAAGAAVSSAELSVPHDVRSAGSESRRAASSG